MTLTDTTARSQTDSLSLEFDLPHPPDKVWRALTDPVLLAEWLLPVVDLDLDEPAIHGAVPTGVRLRLERERRPPLKLEIDDGQEPLGEQHGVGERAPHLLRRMMQIEIE